MEINFPILKKPEQKSGSFENFLDGLRFMFVLGLIVGIGLKTEQRKIIISFEIN